MNCPRRLALTLAPLLTLACGSSAGPGPGVPDGGGNDGPAAVDRTPITERAPRTRYQCRVARDRTTHAPRHWRAFPALATTANGPWLVRRESMNAQPTMPVPGDLVVGSLGVDGSFGTTTPLAPSTASTVGPMSAAPTSSGFAVVFVEGDKLRFAAFDATGAMTGSMKDVATGLDELATPKLAAGPDGNFGVVYAPLVGSARQVHFLLLDATGTAKAAARRLDQGSSNAVIPPLPAPAIAASPSGYAVIFRDPHDARGGIDFAKAALDGSELVTRRRLWSATEASTTVGTGAGFDAPTNAIIDTPTGFVAAWTEVHLDPMSFSSGGWSIVQLARLDGNGVMEGAPAPLRARTDSINEVEPTLVHYGDALGVLWARGSQIYICGGCVPDHRIDLLLVDPSDLAPLGNVVSITNGGGAQAGGLLRRQVAVVGKSLLVTYQLTFHVHATAGSAAFACDP